MVLDRYITGFSPQIHLQRCPVCGLLLSRNAAPSPKFPRGHPLLQISLARSPLQLRLACTSRRARPLHPHLLRAAAGPRLHRHQLTPNHRRVTLNSPAGKLLAQRTRRRWFGPRRARRRHHGEDGDGEAELLVAVVAPSLLAERSRSGTGTTKEIHLRHHLRSGPSGRHLRHHLRGAVPRRAAAALGDLPRLQPRRVDGKQDPGDADGSSSKILWIVAIVVPVSVLLACFLACFLWIRKRRRRVTSMSGTVSVPTMSMEMEQVLKLWRIEESDSEFSLFDFDQIADATDNFSDHHKLGQGGFGPVYKGELPGGLEIAIKRLSSCSVQGLMEFKTEIQLIAKLQHTNLVRLLGCCVQAEEKMLIYEYMHNKSLDFFIFDAEKGKILTWEQRFRIIDGVAQGLLYLHKHSRLRVIHRDLKASNILLDRDMNPKISDFGMARIFCSNVTEANTTRVVGTHGYIAPEYASEGLFSIKSDVFSFGVLLLEIITGKRTAGFYQYGKFFNLTGYAYQLWQDGKWHELVDPSLGDDVPVAEVMKCLQVALLCVQDSADDRPNMSEVVAMLGSEGITMPEPRQPAYYNVRISSLAVSSDSFGESSCRISNITLTDHEEGR